MDYQTASLATATNTRLDSACKHIQQCRVSYDHMLYFVENAHELERNKMQYCVHKDEMVVGINRPWKKKRVINNMGVSAYPKVFTCLGDISQTRYEHELKMIKYLYHFATSIPQRDAIIGHFDNEGPTTLPILGGADYFADGANRANLSSYLQKMFDLYPVGVSNTLGYAHPNSGDTMSSVMIGGLRTVMNGDFEVFAGDLVQWYWTFEVDCFHIATGRRHRIVDPAGNLVSGVDPETDYTDGYRNPARAQIPARYHNDYQYGADPLNRPSSKARHVARVKPYLRDDDQPRLYDWFRVFAVAISSAKPNEMVDIKIGRQSL